MASPPESCLARPHEAIAFRGLLVIGPDGRIHFASKWAREILRNSFSSRGSLPGEVVRRIFGEPAPFGFVAGGQNRLGFQVVYREVGSACLLIKRDVGLPSLGADALTNRQREVLDWVARGKTNAEIAQILSLKTGTVGKYLERIFAKLGVENRTAAASYVSYTAEAS